MNKKIMSAAAAAVVFFSAAGSSLAYTLYSEGKSAYNISGNYSEELLRLNSELYEAVRSYSLTPVETTEQQPEKTAEATGEAVGSSEEQTEPQPTEEAPDTAGLYTELLALAQEYHSETAKYGRELAGKLMDYDVALKKLKILISRYDSRKEYTEKLEKLVLTGECDAKTAQSAKDEVDEAYYEIKALLFDISVLKSDIESVTGEALKDDFDFNGVYLITDALKLDGERLYDRSQLGSLYVPEGAGISEFEAEDCVPLLNDSVQAYYSLGAALRDYISAAAAKKEGESSMLLGQMTSDELRQLTEAQEDSFLAAAQAKAELSKALLALDEVTGKSISGAVMSAQEASALCGTLPEDARGKGMWLALRTSGGAEFLPVRYPAGAYPIDEEDTAHYSYIMKYDGQEICAADCGSSCRAADIEYKDGLNYAEVTFFRNRVSVGTYRVNIFTPYGEFE